MTNHFAAAESLLAKADGCVVESLTRQFVSRAAVHAQLAQVQVLEDAFGLQPAVSTSTAYPRTAIETRQASGDRL